MSSDLTCTIEKLTHLNLRNYKNSFSSEILQHISKYRHIYQDYAPASFHTPKEQLAYWLFWWPRQIAILESFLRLSKKELKFPVLDFGCGGSPGLFLYPNEEWWVWDQDFSLVETLSTKLSHQIKKINPMTLQNNFPKTLLMMMSFAEINPSLSLFETFLKNNCDIVVIEPGTQTHFQKLVPFRNHFSSQVVFPCPEISACPLSADKKNWCSARRPWEYPEWYASLAQRIQVDFRFLKFTGFYLSSSENSTSKRSVSIPKKVGSKKAKLWDLDVCTKGGLLKERIQSSDPPWPWDELN